MCPCCPRPPRCTRPHTHGGPAPPRHRLARAADGGWYRERGGRGPRHGGPFPSLRHVALQLRVHARVLLCGIASAAPRPCRHGDDLPARRPEQKEESWELFAIRRTITQMLIDREYTLPPEDSDDLTYESFVQRWNGKEHKNLTILAGKKNDEDQKIGVFFPQNPPEARTRKLSVDSGPNLAACTARMGPEPRARAPARLVGPHLARRPPCPSARCAQRLTRAFRRDAVKSVINLMKEQAVQRGILVVEKPLMGHAQQTIDMETEQRKLNNEDWRIEVFLAGKHVFRLKLCRSFETAVFLAGGVSCLAGLPAIHRSRWRACAPAAGC
jgi:hypothetical protein